MDDNNDKENLLEVIVIENDVETGDIEIITISDEETEKEEKKLEVEQKENLKVQDSEVALVDTSSNFTMSTADSEDFNVPDEYRNAYHCTVCNTHMNSPVTWLSHIRGKRHKKKCASVPKGTTIGTENSEAFKMSDESMGDYHCIVCDTRMNSQVTWLSHICGKKHKMKSASALEGKTPKLKPSREVACIMKKLKDSQLLLVGLEFVTEKKKKNGVLYYHCHICGGHYESQKLITSHITSVKHQFAYVEKMDPSTAKYITELKLRNILKEGLITESAINLRNKFGPGKVNVQVRNADHSLKPSKKKNAFTHKRKKQASHLDTQSQYTSAPVTSKKSTKKGKNEYVPGKSTPSILLSSGMEDSNDKEEVLEEIVEMEEEVEIIEDVEIMEIEVITITDDENEEPQQKPKTEQRKKSDAEQKQKSAAGQKQKSKDSGSQAPLTLRKAVPGIKGNEKSVPQSNTFFDCDYGRLMRCAKRFLPGTAKKKARKTDNSGVEAVNHVTKDKNGPQPGTTTVTTTVNDTVTPSTNTSTIINKTNPQLSTSTISINDRSEPQLNARIATTTVPAIEVNSGDATKIDHCMPDKSRGDFYCKLCDKHTYRETDWSFHINGKKHKMKLNAGPVDAIVVSNFQYFDVEAKLMTQLKDHGSAIVGLDFITEKQFMSGVTNYECHMCNGRFDEADIIPHIASFKHRYSYVQKVDADWLKFKANPNGPSARVGTISDRIASLEKQFGQGKILVKIQKSDCQATYNCNNTSENTIRPGFNKEYLQEVLRHNPTSEYAPKHPKRPKNATRRLAPFVDTPGPDILVPVISEVADEVSTTVNATRPGFDNAYLQEVLRHNPTSDYSSKHPKKQRFKKLPPKKKNLVMAPPIDDTPIQNISIRITPKKPFHKRRNFSPHETSPPHPLWKELNGSVAVPSATFPQTAQYNPPTPLQFPCGSSVPPQDRYEPPPLQFPSQQPQIACGPLQFPYDPPVSSQGYGLPPSQFPHESQQPQIACGPPSPSPQIPYEQPVSEPVPYDASQLPYNLPTCILPPQPTYPSSGPTHSETVDFNGFGTNTSSLYQSFQKSSTSWSILAPHANNHPVNHESSNSQKRTLPEEFILKVIQLFPEYRRFQLLKKMAWSHIPNREELQRDFIITICNSLIQYKISRFPEHSSLLLLKLELAKLQAASHDLSFERLFNHLQQKEYYYTHQNPSSKVDSSRFQDAPKDSNMSESTYGNTSTSVYSDMSVPTHSNTNTTGEDNVNTTIDTNIHQHSERSNMTFSFQSTDESNISKSMEKPSWTDKRHHPVPSGGSSSSSECVNRGFSSAPHGSSYGEIRTNASSSLDQSSNYLKTQHQSVVEYPPVYSSRYSHLITDNINSTKNHPSCRQRKRSRSHEKHIPFLD